MKSKLILIVLMLMLLTACDDSEYTYNLVGDGEIELNDSIELSGGFYNYDYLMANGVSSCADDDFFIAYDVKNPETNTSYIRGQNKSFYVGTFYEAYVVCQNNFSNAVIIEYYHTNTDNISLLNIVLDKDVEMFTSYFDEKSYTYQEKIDEVMNVIDDLENMSDNLINTDFNRAFTTLYLSFFTTFESELKSMLYVNDFKALELSKDFIKNFLSYSRSIDFSNYDDSISLTVSFPYSNEDRQPKKLSMNIAFSDIKTSYTLYESLTNYCSPSLDNCRDLMTNYAVYDSETRKINYFTVNAIDERTEISASNNFKALQDFIIKLN